MTLDDNKAIVQRLYDEGMNRQDAVAAARCYAVDAKNHGRAVGQAGMQSVFEALFATFPDFHYRVERMTAEGDRVVARVVLEGTHLGQPTRPDAFSGMLTGVPPTGRRVQVPQYHGFRLCNGEIAEHDAVRDDMAMCQQLGIVVRPG